MKIDESAKKHLFSNTWTKKIVLSFNFNSVELTTLVHTLLTEIIPLEYLTEGLKSDVKGRDKANLLLNEFTFPSLPNEDELVFISASSLIDPDFSVEFRLNSNFDTFQGTHHIVHRNENKIKGLTNRKINPLLLACSSPLRIESFRFGLERFQSKLAPLSLGYVPTVVERITIDCLNSNGIAEITSDSLNNSLEYPFGQIGHSLVDTLKNLFQMQHHL